MSSHCSRPRLADHVALRQHVRDDEAFTTLHDDHSELVIKLGRRETAVLLAADGSRDHEGIALAARRAGVVVASAMVEEMFGALRQHGLVVDGPPAHDPEVATLGLRDSELPANRPVRSLAEFRFYCDGKGACCRQYGSVLFTPTDRVNALAAYPGHRVGPWPIEYAFTPERGSAPSPMRAATSRDGACMFLEKDGGCGIHRRAGSQAKPSGCLLFPLRFVDDGDVVRATALTECRCVLAEPPDAAQALVSPGLKVQDLPSLAVIHQLPETVEVDDSCVWSREALRSWSHQALQALQDSSDPAQWCWQEADLIRNATSTALDETSAWFGALAARLARLTRSLEDSRLESGLALKSARWLASACTLLADSRYRVSVVAQPPPDVGVERRATRLVVWGFSGLDERTMCSWLRDRAVRLWAARVMASIRSAEFADAALDQPIAVIDALLRGHGLSDYH